MASASSKHKQQEQRILSAITKLQDKNTQPGAIHDIGKLVEVGQFIADCV